MTAACLLVRSPACSARQLQTSIVQVVHLCPTGFRKEPCERLERHKPKGLRVVLRGLGSSNAPRLPGGGGGDVTSLPDTWVGNHPGLPGPDYARHRITPPRITPPLEGIRGVLGTPYLTSGANSGKSGRASREQALRPMCIGQARLELLALSASCHERMVNGWAAASGKARIDLCAGIAWIGA